MHSLCWPWNSTDRDIKTNINYLFLFYRSNIAWRFSIILLNVGCDETVRQYKELSQPSYRLHYRPGFLYGNQGLENNIWYCLRERGLSIPGCCPCWWGTWRPAQPRYQHGELRPDSGARPSYQSLDSPWQTSDKEQGRPRACPGYSRHDAVSTSR